MSIFKHGFEIAFQVALSKVIGHDGEVYEGFKKTDVDTPITQKRPRQLRDNILAHLTSMVRHTYSMRGITKHKK